MLMKAFRQKDSVDECRVIRLDFRKLPIYFLEAFDL